MKDELKDGFNRLRELAESIKDNVNDKRNNLASSRIDYLISLLDVLETEIEFAEDER